MIIWFAEMVGIKMNEDIDRILKGYRPRSNKDSYWVLYYLFELIAIMKIKIFSMLKS